MFFAKLKLRREVIPHLKILVLIYYIFPLALAFIRITWKRPQIANIGPDVEKRERLYIVGGNVNWCSHCRKQFGSLQKKKKKLKIDLSYDLAIPLLGIYLKKMKTLI